MGRRIQRRLRAAGNGSAELIPRDEVFEEIALRKEQ
jgi:hypothetical protein